MFLSLFLINGYSIAILPHNIFVGESSTSTFKLHKLNRSRNVQKISKKNIQLNIPHHEIPKNLIQVEEDNEYTNSDENEVPPLLPTRATEEIIHRDSGGSLRFKVVTYVGLTMIVIILCLFIVWKFCPRSCFCGRGQSEDLNGEIGIESGIVDVNGQIQIDTIDQNENDFNLETINASDDENKNQINDIKEKDETQNNDI